jgi:hypothetical protein
LEQFAPPFIPIINETIKWKKIIEENTNIGEDEILLLAGEVHHQSREARKSPD